MRTNNRVMTQFEQPVIENLQSCCKQLDGWNGGMPAYISNEFNSRFQKKNLIFTQTLQKYSSKFVTVVDAFHWSMYVPTSLMICPDLCLSFSSLVLCVVASTKCKKCLSDMEKEIIWFSSKYYRELILAK